MKKIIAFLVSIFSVFSCTTLVACGKHDDGGNEYDLPPVIADGGLGENNTLCDGFVGLLSAEIYDSAAHAAQAFVECEVEGVYVDYEVGSELTSTEIAELNIGDADKSSIKAINSIIVKYKIPEVSTYSLNVMNDDDEKQAECLLIEYDNGQYSYYVLASEVGHAVTRSYLEAVFDLDSYCNSKIMLANHQKSTVNNPSGVMIEEQNVIYERTAYIYDNAAMVGSFRTEENLDRDTTQNNRTYYYINRGDVYYEDIYYGDIYYDIEYKEDKDNYSLFAYSNNTYIYNFEWRMREAICATDGLNYPSYCFIKTENGFESNEEYTKLYCDSNFDNEQFQYMNIVSNKKTYTVSDGRVAHIEWELKITLDSPELGIGEYSEIETVTITDADKTKDEIIIPAVQKLVDDLEAGIEAAVQKNLQYFELPSYAAGISSEQIVTREQWENAFYYSDIENGTIIEVHISYGDGFVVNQTTITKCDGNNTQSTTETVYKSKNDIFNEDADITTDTEYYSSNFLSGIMHGVGDNIYRHYDYVTYETDEDGTKQYVLRFDQQSWCKTKIVDGKAIYFEFCDDGLLGFNKRLVYLYDIGTTVIDESNE